MGPGNGGWAAVTVFTPNPAVSCLIHASPDCRKACRRVKRCEAPGQQNGRWQRERRVVSKEYSEGNKKKKPSYAQWCLLNWTTSLQKKKKCSKSRQFSQEDHLSTAAEATKAPYVATRGEATQHTPRRQRPHSRGTRTLIP